MSDDQYPLMTSTNSTGDTATQGFNTSVLESLDPALAKDPAGTVGQRSTGADVLAGVEWYPDNDPHPQESKLDDYSGDQLGHPATVRANIASMRHATEHVPVVRIQAPNKVGTLGFFFPAPNGSSGLVQCVQVLTADPKRYRVQLHPWTTGTSTPGQLWLGSDPGNVVQTASGNISLSAYPLDRGGTISGAGVGNTAEFYWTDDMWVSLDIAATVDTYLFVVVEKYL